MLHPNANTLYEPLYREVTHENVQLRRRVKQLEEGIAEWQKRAKEAEEQVKKQEDANKKLRALLFEKQHPKTRTKRKHVKQVRSVLSYVRPTPTKITERKELEIESCPHCGTAVNASVSQRTRIIEDIIFHPEPEVTEWTVNRYWCPCCNKQVSGTVPGIMPGTRIGPNTLVFVVLQKYRWNQPYEKIKEQLELCFGLKVSEGEIANLITVAAKLSGNKWHEIEEAVKSGEKVHCDETGWYINGKKVWAHTFANDSAVLYEILPTRGKQVAENRLQGYQGVRITDCLANYKNLSGQHQICWAHLTREAQENKEREKDNIERAVLSERLDVIYKDLRLASGDNWEEAKAQSTLKRCRKRFDKLRNKQWDDYRSGILIKRMEDFDHALFTCLSAPGIPPDNNHAERVLRKLVVQRKISGGNRSPAHAEHHAKLMSVIETFRLEGGNLLPKLQNLFQVGIATQLSGG